MIRDKNKIYGEMNDPNTVIATGTLTPEMIIVGAGNKGVKTFDPGAKKIIYTDTSGIPKGFSYNTANKVIGTDSSGNLVLKDMPTGNKITDILVSSASISGSSTISATVYNQPYTNISTADTARNLLEGAGNISLIKLVQSTDAYVYPTITLTLKTPLVLKSAKTIKLILAVSPDGNYGSSLVIPFILSGVKLGSVQIMKQYLGGMVNFPGQNSHFSGEISLSANTYSQLILEGVQLSKGTGWLRVSGCFIE